MATQDILDVPLLPLPPPEVRSTLSDGDLRACFSLWDVICQRMLELPPELLQIAFARTQSGSISTLLVSYVGAAASSQHDTSWRSLSEAQRFNRRSFLLIHRSLKELQKPPETFLQLEFLGFFCKVYQHSPSLEGLLESVWQAHSSSLQSASRKHHNVLVSRLEGTASKDTQASLVPQWLLPLLAACPSAGASLVVGSDLLDAICISYTSVTAISRSSLLLLVFLMLLATLRLAKPNRSLTYDHLYNLKASADLNISDAKGYKAVLTDLMTNTPFLARFRKLTAGGVDAGRGLSLAASLEPYRKTHDSRPKKLRPRKIDKGKGKAPDSYGHGETINGVHVHRLSLISQIQELFPDLGNGFIVKLLDQYGDDAEQVTAALLDGNLPPNLQDADQSEQLPSQPSANNIDPIADLDPGYTPPPSPPSQRRNIYDNDDFDRLAISPSQLRRKGKEPDHSNLNQDATSRSHAKAAIMSALTAFDADDDERDDTYDIEDVGGTVDTAGGPEGDREANIDDMREKSEEALFTAWKMDQSMFARDSATRRGKQRQALKSETGMTDEAVEGWGVMLQRDPPRLRRLEARYATFSGRQDLQLERTSWRASHDTGTESEDGGGVSSGTDAPRGGRGRGVFRGRGRGRGGSVAGPADEKGTQVARQRKDANKGSRANHNRRDARAKKIGRAGFPG